MGRRAYRESLAARMTLNHICPGLNPKPEALNPKQPGVLRLKKPKNLNV